MTAAAMGTQDVRVRPNRVLLCVVLAAGLAFGFLPFLLYLRVPQLALLYLPYSALVLGWSVRRFTGNATEHPDVLEWLLAGWNAVAMGASSSLIAFIWYGLSYGLVWGAAYVARALGWTLDVEPALIGTYVSVFFGAVFALFVPVLAGDQVPPKLFPQIAGTRSAFFPLTANPWRLALAGALAVIAIAAGVVFLDTHGLWFTVLLALLLAGLGGPLLERGGREVSSAEVVQVTTALSKALAAAGYAVTVKPRTGDPEVDPLITPVDVLAVAANRGYAVKVKVVGAGETDVEWIAASDIRRAAKAMQRPLRGDGAAAVELEPYLLVIGGSISPDLRSFAEEEGVKLVHCSDTHPLFAALKQEATAADLQDIADHVLHVHSSVTSKNVPARDAVE